MRLHVNPATLILVQVFFFNPKYILTAIRELTRYIRDAVNVFFPYVNSIKPLISTVLNAKLALYIF